LQHSNVPGELERLKAKLACLGPVSLMQKIILEEQIQALSHKMAHLPTEASNRKPVAESSLEQPFPLQKKTAPPPSPVANGFKPHAKSTRSTSKRPHKNSLERQLYLFPKADER
jgi:hypothetical protein